MDAPAAQGSLGLPPATGPAAVGMSGVMDAPAA